MSSKYLVQVVEKVTDGQKNIVQKILVFSLSEAQRLKNIYLENYPDCIIEVKRRYRDGWKMVQV
ncbi:hypothetical protein HUW86_09605 [Fusobacterium sp. SB021]|uniref:hypothetical protein n=1 Tax=Fusobacterium sp. SB021 TaxID=2744227 RepID=UPI003CF23287